MALLPEIPTLPPRRLLTAGVPAFLAAALLSIAGHHQAHRLGAMIFCGEPHAAAASAPLHDAAAPAADCAMSALAGQLWTVGLAVGAFALFLRHPGSLFLLSMAFVNATSRLPEAVTVFVQYLSGNGTTLPVDESLSLSLIGLADPTIPTVILCFYTITLLFFSIIIVHDARTIRYKWPIAALLFVSMGAIERGVAWVLVLPSLG